MSGRGSVVGVVGPPGIGKSRLVREAVEIAKSRGVRVFSTYCESHASQIPFHAVARLFRAAARISGLDDAAARAQLRSPAARRRLRRPACCSTTCWASPIRR